MAEVEVEVRGVAMGGPLEVDLCLHQMMSKLVSLTIDRVVIE